ncbi:patatin-like phospholipase family protein [Shewanella sp. 202IG2-18]|uniref:patatin-like phospholipase family protein n=1 Tax=Parashewanella hymeniacidonis TaxID=2807618 RepID=UPI00196182B4|nr:patatin-like phospholipase family protein [Parashewanella hymeniacidonis]MBM7072240.1 patatin-like phospholipase family protein [Parashewanella hymeniacidonis]
MKIHQQIFATVIIFATAFSVSARPKIGLVLSGGGAKGAAHIGVLKILEQNHIPVDYIAGTSIGAYVGGLYALGYSADEIEKLMLNTDWSKGYSDTIPRQSLSYRDKQQRDQYNVPLSIGYSKDKIKTPSGLLLGQTMSRLLRGSTGLVQKFGSFDQLAIPYRAVATDLATSHAVVLDSGSIVFAMQASATVPGALELAHWHGKLLVDGGIANNMPVDVVKKMGADIVIAVDIGSSLVSKDKLNSTVDVLNQLSTILTNASTNHQKSLLTDKDILIRPAVGQMSTTDFNVLPKALAFGEKAATTLLPKLKALAETPQQYAHYQQKKLNARKQWDAPINKPVYRIVLANESKVNDQLILDTFGIHEGEVVSKKELDTAINRVYALNRFERVNAEFADDLQGRELTLTTKAKSWGPNYFQLGLNWEDDYSLGSTVTFDFAYTLTDLNENGGEWRNELQFGFQKRIASEFYQPLDHEQNWYSRTRLELLRKNRGIFESNEFTYGVDTRSQVLLTGLGYNFNQKSFIELGMRGTNGRLSTQAIEYGKLKYKGFGGYLQLGYDDLDSISFPTSGDRLSFEMRFTRNNARYQDQDYESDFNLRYSLDWKGALSVGHHAFVGKLSLETEEVTDDDISVDPVELGGFLNLSGYHKDSLLGNHKLFGAFIYQYDLGRDALGLEKYPLYLGSSIEAGNVWLQKSDVSLNDLIYSGSLYLGTDTELGPAALGIGLSDKGEHAVYLFIGKNF